MLREGGRKEGREGGREEGGGKEGGGGGGREGGRREERGRELLKFMLETTYFSSANPCCPNILIICSFFQMFF